MSFCCCHHLHVLLLQVAVIQAQLDLKKCSLDTALSLGKKLRENPKTGQVTSVKDSMAKLSTSWSDFEELLKENVQQVTPCINNTDTLSLC